MLHTNMDWEYEEVVVHMNRVVLKVGFVHCTRSLGGLRLGVWVVSMEPRGDRAMYGN